MMKKNNLLDKNILLAILITNIVMLCICLPFIILYFGESVSIVGLGSIIMFPIISIILISWFYFTEV